MIDFREGKREEEGGGRERERERETLICCFTYLCFHWLFLVCALTEDQTHNLGVLGQRSNHPSYPATAPSGFLVIYSFP